MIRDFLAPALPLIFRDNVLFWNNLVQLRLNSYCGMPPMRSCKVTFEYAVRCNRSHNLDDGNENQMVHVIVRGVWTPWKPLVPTSYVNKCLSSCEACQISAPNFQASLLIHEWSARSRGVILLRCSWWQAFAVNTSRLSFPFHSAVSLVWVSTVLTSKNNVWRFVQLLSGSITWVILLFFPIRSFWSEK